MRHGRIGRAWWGLGVLIAAIWACETTRNPGGVQPDLTRPFIALFNTVGDTQDISTGLQFGVTASDNLALKQIRLIFSGGFVGLLDTNFTGTVKDVSLGRTITFPPGSGAGGTIFIVGRATDGAGNFAEDTLAIFLANVQALQVILVAPAPGAVASTGLNIPVEVIATQNTGIRKIGFLVSPASAVTNPTTPPADSILYAAPYSDSIRYADTLTVQATGGTFVIVGFAEDSTGRRGTSATVTVAIQSAANDLTAPTVSHTVGARVEVSDSVSVHATDPSAIDSLGLRIRDAGGVQLRFDKLDVSAGNLTDVSRNFSLNLAGIITSFPAIIIVEGWACDGATPVNNCAFSQTSTVIGLPPGAVRAPDGTGGLANLSMAGPGEDTIVVVAGTTRPLPAGGRISDAIFNAVRNELYLTNTPLNRIEIFQVANTAFVANGIPSGGPQPVGIALWPRDTLGNYGDTIVVANAGGTYLSIIDVSPAVRRLVWRQHLPNFLIQRYKVQNIAGNFFAEIELFDVSDRPQYVATVCRPGGGTACHADSIFALYSTTPTESSAPPFAGRATLRLEKLVNSPTNPAPLFGHLFWEIGNSASGRSNDTLRVVLRRGLPYNQTLVVLTACAGVTLDFDTFGLGDSTFARNSGNFTHGFFGEGGDARAAFARVMAYSARLPLVHGPATQTTCFTSPDTIRGPVDAGQIDVDFGMSPAIDVSDFISNTGTKVFSIATNFNGGTNLVRADSIYFLDEGLRLQGTAGAPTGAPGMDMNYNHAFRAGSPGTPTFPPPQGGPASPNDRVAFAARPDANIDVFDTFFYGQDQLNPRRIAIRDPIIGPLRVARDAGGNQLLFGITGRGLVMVRLPPIISTYPVRAP